MDLHKLGEQLKTFKAKHAGATDVREATRLKAIDGIRVLERLLVDALDGETLRGLPNLGAGSVRYYGIRVRTQRDCDVGENAAESVRHDEVPLVLSKEGVLVFAEWEFDATGNDLPGILSTPAVDAGLLIEDLEAFMRTVCHVVPRHLAALAQSMARFERIAKIAEQLPGLTGT